MNAALLLLSLIACTGTNKDSDDTTAGTTGTEGTEGTDTTEGTDPGSDGTETTEGTDSEGTSATDGTSGTEGTDPETTCGGIQAQYDLYAAVTACTQPSDCQVLNGQCWTGLGGCYMVVNDSINQGQLDVLGQAWNDEGCGGGACKCGAAAEVDCVNDVCQFVVSP